MNRSSQRESSAPGGARGGEGRGWRFYAAAAIALLALIFVIQNNEETQVTFLFAETRLPLFFALIVAILLGAAIGWLAPKVRRSNRASRTDDT
jgi:uncharacterized integral membrane protein